MKNKNRIKLIVMDMDGTLLHDDKQLPEEFWNMESALYNKNILFAAASGRQYYNLLHLFERISNRCFFIAENGSHVLYKDECLYFESILKDDAIDLIKTGRKIESADVILCGVKSAYIENNDPKLIKLASQYYTKLEIVDDLTLVSDDFLKITMCDYAGAQENSFIHFKHLDKKFKIAVSGKKWLDITNKKADKGKAIKTIQEKTGISFDETMVFGDYKNDLEMMKSAKYSYAMKNAQPEVKDAANFITEYTNNENGAIKTVEKVVLEAELV